MYVAQRKPLRISSLACILIFWCASAFAAPISADIDKNVNLAIGQRNFGPVSVPDGLSVCSLSIDRTNWTNPASTMSVQLSMSVNGGPFVPWLGMTSDGESGLGASTAMQRDLPAGSNRKVQGSYVVQGARFISTITVTCS